MMLTLKNFQPYTPDCIDYLYPALYLQDEEGRDWYYHLTRFQPDTLKILYNSDGIICGFSPDASRLWPVGLSIAEVAVTDVPANLSIGGEWEWNGSAIVPCLQTGGGRVARRAALMAVASSAIEPLQDASEMGIATPEELQQLTEWKTYRVMLNRVDLSAPEIAWPEVPGYVA